MVKPIFIIFVLLNLYNPTFSQNNSFSLKGFYKGEKKPRIVIRYTYNNTEVRDTANVAKGKFHIKGRVNHPSLADIQILYNASDVRKDTIFTFFIEPTNMRMLVYEKDISKSTITGSATQKILNRMRSEQRSSFLYLDSINSDHLNNNKDSLLNNNTYDLWFKEQRDSILDILYGIEKKYLYKNINTFFSAYFLYYQLDRMSLDSVKTIYEKWPKKIKDSRYGNTISEEISKRERSSLFNKAPDFRAITFAGDTVQLSDLYKKKIVLIDFWASWCLPCRDSFLRLKDLVSKLGTDSFVVVAISTDSEREKWKKAIIEDQTSSWIHVLANKDNKQNYDILLNYKSSPIPIRYLINKEGNIINEWVGQSNQIDIELEIAIRKLL